jgi:peroxiredoxin
MKKLSALFASACLAAALLHGPALNAAPAVGSAAPDFSLPDTNGKTHALTQHKGKFVVLEWVNPQCPFVKKHYGSGNMQKLQTEYTKKDVVWLSIDSSAKGKEGYLTPEAGNAWLKEAKASPSALLLDPDGKVGQLYGAKTTPHMYIINPEGKLIYEGAIDSIKSADVADIAKAENYVKAGLDEAMAGKPVKTANSKAYGCSVKY